MLSSADVLKLFQQYVVPNYTRYPVALAHGEGSYVWDAEGNRYLDFFPGWGCNLLGHCPSRSCEAVQEQVATLIHVPNTWYTEAQGRWAKALSERSFGGQAFFCNSGTEANEAAIKLARLHTPKQRYKIITFEAAFTAARSARSTATAQPKYHEGLGPLMAGFVYAPFGDLDAVARLIDDETAAIMIEPIQGEGGVRIPPDGFLAGLRKLADEHGLLLMFDEVQTGCGRTGHWFAYQHFGVTPDIMTLAKALCGGIAGGGDADHGRDRSQPAARHARGHVRRQPDRRPGRPCGHRNDRKQNLLEAARQLGRDFPRAAHANCSGSANWFARSASAGLMIGVELAIDGTADRARPAWSGGC